MISTDIIMASADADAGSKVVVNKMCEKIRD